MKKKVLLATIFIALLSAFGTWYYLTFHGDGARKGDDTYYFDDLQTFEFYTDLRMGYQSVRFCVQQYAGSEPQYYRHSHDADENEEIYAFYLSENEYQEFQKFLVDIGYYEMDGYDEVVYTDEPAWNFSTYAICGLYLGKMKTYRATGYACAPDNYQEIENALSVYFQKWEQTHEHDENVYVPCTSG